MFCYTADHSPDWPDARVYVLSDLHLGDPHIDMPTVTARIRRIIDDTRGLCILNGDILNTATRQGVSDVYAETIPPMEQIRLATDLLRPIADRVIAADTGNHESRTYKTDGIDMMRLVCRQLGIEDRYAPEGVLCFLRFGQKSTDRSNGRAEQPMIYSIYATHGTGGGRKEGAKAIRLADMAGIVDADVYVHSHTHLPMVMRQSFFRVDVQNRMARDVEKLFVNDAATIRYGGYGQSYEFKPASLESPVIWLNGTKREMKATL